MVKIRTGRFTVTYTRGDTLRTETGVLEGTVVRQLGCGCERVRFVRPGGAIADTVTSDGSDVMEAISGACGVGHLSTCEEIN